MSKVTSMVESDQMIIAGTLYGDILVWDTRAIFDKVDHRLHDPIE